MISFLVGVGLQFLANLLLGYGGLFLAYYTLAEDIRPVVQDAIVKRLFWILPVLGVGLIIILVGIVPLPFIVYVDVTNLGRDEDIALFQCIMDTYKQAFGAFIQSLFSRSDELTRILEACFLERTGQQLPNDPGGFGYKIELVPWSAGRLTGMILSIIAMMILLFLSRSYLMRTEPNTTKITNAFTAIIVGVMLQIFLQGTSDLFQTKFQEAPAVIPYLPVSDLAKNAGSE